MDNDCINSENDLLAQVAQGDERAFAQIVAHYAPVIFAHVLSYLKNVPQSEEITQDIFISIWNNRIDLPQISNFKGYIYRSARNRCISAWRKQLQTLHPIEATDLEDPLGNPQKKLETQELQQFLYQAIEKLPPRRKQVFKMSRLEGKTYEEIASQLGISRSAVNQHIVESLVFLRQQLHIQSGVWILVFLPLGTVYLN